MNLWKAKVPLSESKKKMCSNSTEDRELENPSDLKAVRALIEIAVGPRVQDLVLKVLKPELAQKASSRSSVTIESFNQGLHINVKGTDLSSFRASLNSIMRLLNVIFGVLRTLSITRDDVQGG
jgi:tRNA threonylcarbamoyladenosine modification (KEOPS) complex  Pcc1 subunit